MNRPPQQIFLEVSGRCNLACVHCPKDYGRPEAALEQDLPLETIERLRPWLEQARFVNLNVVGESLLAPHFDDVVRRTCAGEAEVPFNTNGLLLTERRCEFLVAQGVNSIAVSFDGLETHERVRGVRYEVVRDRLLTLAAARERARSARPHLAIAYTLMRRNLRELPLLLANLLPRCRIHAVHVQPLVVFYETLRGENVYEADDVDEVAARCRDLCARTGTDLVLFRSQFAQDERNLERERLAHELGPTSPIYGCTDPFFEIKIRATGEVISCSYGLSSGDDVRERELDEIWNGPWYRSTRRRLYAHVFEGRCESCPFLHGSAANQLAPLRSGVHHSAEGRFLDGRRSTAAHRQSPGPRT
jgi:MoaA/NifB/PqqE/SkfB family radical SAM enzyme